jgi:hypothetical protein
MPYCADRASEEQWQSRKTGNSERLGLKRTTRNADPFDEGHRIARVEARLRRSRQEMAT